MLPAVVHIVGLGKIPVAIPDDEMHSLRVAVHSRMPLFPVEYSPGQNVQIEHGPLAGAKGIVVGRNNERFIVSVTLLQRSIAVELNSEWLAPLCRTA